MIWFSIRTFSVLAFECKRRSTFLWMLGR
jgi:hypothetical protein